MKSKIEKEISVILKLDVEEAEWLKCLCQNPIGDIETEKNAIMRSRFFNTLNNHPELK